MKQPDHATTVFPKWMIRLNPYLRRADRNVLYIYLDERARKRSFKSRCIDFLVAYIHVLIISIASVYFFAGGWPPWPIWLQEVMELFVVCGVLIVLVEISIQAVSVLITKPVLHLPYRGLHLVGANSRYLKIPEEIWVVGSQGDEVQEAIYFAHATSAFSKSLVVWGLLTGTTALVFFIPTHLGLRLIMFISISYIFFECLMSWTRTLGMSSNVVHSHRKLFLMLIRLASKESKIRRIWRLVVYYLPAVVVAIAIFSAMIAAFVFGVDHWISITPYFTCLYLVISVVAIFLGIKTRLQRKQNWIKTVREFERAKADMRFAFDTYIRSAIIEDPDWMLGIEAEVEALQQPRTKRK